MIANYIFNEYRDESVYVRFILKYLKMQIQIRNL